jgi:hypothetical protein
MINAPNYTHYSHVKKTTILKTKDFGKPVKCGAKIAVKRCDGKMRYPAKVRNDARIFNSISTVGYQKSPEQ